MIEKNSALVSVIVPTYNRAHTLKRAIDSVYKQTYKNIELIVVDDGSVDNTEKVINEKFEKIIYIKTTNKGVSAARNKGIEISRGKYICFLDSDDEWLSNKVEKQITLMENSSFRWVHGEERWIRNGVRVNPRKVHKKSGGDIFIRSLHLCLISPSTVLLEKDLLLEFNGFDENYLVCEDFDLWLRILLKFEIGFISDELIIKYGGHNDQLSARYKAMDDFRIKTFEKLLDDEDLSDERKRELVKVALKKCDILISGYQKHGHLEKASKMISNKNRFKQQF